MAALVEILISLFSDVLSKYLIPWFEDEAVAELKKVLPYAEHWVEVIENYTTIKGSNEKLLAAQNGILEALAKDGETAAVGTVNMAIESVVKAMNKG